MILKTGQNNMRLRSSNRKKIEIMMICFSLKNVLTKEWPEHQSHSFWCNQYLLQVWVLQLY